MQQWQCFNNNNTIIAYARGGGALFGDVVGESGESVVDRSSASSSITSISFSDSKVNVVCKPAAREPAP
jgi:hypothetical protein